MFIKGHGVYSLLDSLAHPSRLSLIYEIIPVAFLVEKAGGLTSDLETSCLDVPINGYEQRITFIGGSAKEVEYILSKLNVSTDSL